MPIPANEILLKEKERSGSSLIIFMDPSAHLKIPDSSPEGFVDANESFTTCYFPLDLFLR